MKTNIQLELIVNDKVNYELLDSVKALVFLFENHPFSNLKLQSLEDKFTEINDFYEYYNLYKNFYTKLLINKMTLRDFDLKKDDFKFEISDKKDFKLKILDKVISSNSIEDLFKTSNIEEFLVNLLAFGIAIDKFEKHHPGLIGITLPKFNCGIFNDFEESLKDYLGQIAKFLDIWFSFYFFLFKKTEEKESMENLSSYICE